MVLVRGHYNSVRAAEDVDPDNRVIDVTRYPDIADLYVAADALVTDYSSVFFDFVLTDKPMVFLGAGPRRSTATTTAGFYLDYHETVPGPVCLTTAEVVDTLARPRRLRRATAGLPGGVRPARRRQGRGQGRRRDPVGAPVPLTRAQRACHHSTEAPRRERHMQELDESRLREIAGAAADRLELWTSFVQPSTSPRWRRSASTAGDFAARMLGERPAIERYYMIDPWRHLDDWNKPANQPDDIFEQFHDETMAKTEAQADKRIVLRGRTTEVVDRIPDGDLDLVYIDGDHTLRGITIDLVRLFPKVKRGRLRRRATTSAATSSSTGRLRAHPGVPYAVYFAEAVGRPDLRPAAQAVPDAEGPAGEHAFVDLAGGYRPARWATRSPDARSRRPRRPPRCSAGSPAGPDEPGG